MKTYFIDAMIANGFTIQQQPDVDEEYNGTLVDEYGRDYIFFKRENATCKLWEKSGMYICLFNSPLFNSHLVEKYFDLKTLSDSFIRDNMKALKYFESKM